MLRVYDETQKQWIDKDYSNIREIREDIEIIMVSRVSGPYSVWEKQATFHGKIVVYDDLPAPEAERK